MKLPLKAARFWCVARPLFWEEVNEMVGETLRHAFTTRFGNIVASSQGGTELEMGESKMGTQAKMVQTKKLTVGLPEQLVKDVLELAKNTNRTATDLIRFGLTLAKIYFEERKNGNDLYIGDKNGKAIMKLVFPY